jgi:hypothetical protein
MTLSFWLAITAIHALLLIPLLVFRRFDHPWLLVYFGSTWLADGFGLLFTPATGGGLDVLGAAGSQGWRVFVAHAVMMTVWLSFWVIPTLTAIRLWRGPLRGWVGAALAGMVTLSVLCLVAVKQRWIGTQAAGRLLHWGVEPALLLATGVALVQHIRDQYARKRPLDLLVLALLLECVNLFMKLVFALKPGFVFDPRFSAIYHVVSLVAFFAVYLVVRLRMVKKGVGDSRQRESAPLGSSSG